VRAGGGISSDPRAGDLIEKIATTRHAGL